MGAKVQSEKRTGPLIRRHSKPQVSPIAPWFVCHDAHAGAPIHICTYPVGGHSQLQNRRHIVARTQSLANCTERITGRGVILIWTQRPVDLWTTREMRPKWNEEDTPTSPANGTCDHPGERQGQVRTIVRNTLAESRGGGAVPVSGTTKTRDRHEEHHKQPSRRAAVRRWQHVTPEHGNAEPIDPMVGLLSHLRDVGRRRED